MNKNFRPSQTQLDYLNTDILSHLEEMGENVMENEYIISSIDWYNWDENPRWFVHISRLVRGVKKGYIEVDMICDTGGGDENPLGIISMEWADHGYPCISTQIVVMGEDDEYEIMD
jgi:hypothetical protein